MYLSLSLRIQAILFTKKPLFSQKRHSFLKGTTLFTNYTSKKLEHARIFSSAIELSVFRTYLWSLKIMIIGD